jgi:hypothetical protein
MTNGKNIRLICVSTQNYFALKALGQTADSFNDVINRLLAERSSVSSLPRHTLDLSTTFILSHEGDEVII